MLFAIKLIAFGAAAAFGLFVLLAGVTAPIWYRGPE